MLINISNHPSAHWEKRQIDEATRRWGGVVDMQFPSIDPKWGYERVEQEAQKHIMGYRREIAKYDQPSAFHIMGELVYCFCVVQLLLKGGYMVVASTTERDVVMHNGEKVSRFKFVQFREY
ncbi:MAG: CRISPR-associated protein [Rikenellaceae bacterium]|jgi:hypothetical protein|nr:CRISPR-associated protein [Rikenellaceae bacterium]MBQ5719584.1 CRISPR-associated protein [Alistipes sp.]